MTGASNLSLVVAFTAGIVSFLSPCVLPVVPGYVSYIAGQASGTATPQVERGRVTALLLSACFVLGFGAVFVILGASATAIGRLFVRYRYEANLVGGNIVIAFGLLMVGALRGGIGLLIAYALGLGVPFLLAAVFTRELIGRMSVLRRAGRPLQIAAGVVMVLFGVAMLSGKLTTFSSWLLERFPALARIG